ILPNQYPINITVGDSYVGLADSHSHKVSRHGDDGLEIFGIKAYSHEDNLKHIHWNLTSKFDELIIKELSEAVNYTFLILVDLTVKNDANKNDPAVIDAMMDTLISITESLLDEGYESSIGWLDKESNIIQIEEVYSKDQLTILLKQILLLEQTERKETLLETFSQSDSRDRYSHLVYLTSEQGHERLTNDLVQTKVTELICQSEKKLQKMSNEFIYTPEIKKKLLDKFSQYDSRDRYYNIVYLTYKEGNERLTNNLVQTKVTEFICQSKKKLHKMSNELIYTPKTIYIDLGELSI